MDDVRGPIVEIVCCFKKTTSFEVSMMVIRQLVDKLARATVAMKALGLRQPSTHHIGLKI